MMALTLIPCALFLVRGRPEEKGLEPYGGAPKAGGVDLQQTGMSAAQARKTPMFWMWGFIMVIISGSCVCVTQHTAAYLTDLSYAYAFAAKMAAVVTASLAVGKVVMGVLFDKLGTRLGATLSVSLFISAMVLYCFAQKTAALYIGVCVVGFGLSFSTVAYSVVTQDLFGKRDFASIYGTLVVFSSLGGALGSPLIVAVFDTLGTYRPAWAALALLQACCLVLLQIIFRIKGKEKAA